MSRGQVEKWRGFEGRGLGCCFMMSFVCNPWRGFDVDILTIYSAEWQQSVTRIVIIVCLRADSETEIMSI